MLDMSWNTSTKNIKELYPTQKKVLVQWEYYSQPHEVQAQGAGLNLKAKKTRQGYEKVVGDSIELTKQRYGLSDEEGNDLYNLIVADIEERYGKKELKEHDASRENKESLVVSMNNYFNPPKYKGVCEIKAYLSDEHTGIEPIKVTIIYDKNTLPANSTTHSPPYRSEVDDIREDVQEDLKTLFGIQLWKIGVGLAECDEDLSPLYEHYEIPEPESHDAILQYLLDNTKIDYDNQQVEFPFAPLLDDNNHNHTLSFRHLGSSPSPLFYLRPSKSFMQYVKIGGLGEHESINLWLEYRNILREKFNADERFPVVFLTEQQNLVDLQQDESFTPRGHTIFDDDEYKVWAALDKKSFCEFAKGTKWCDEGPKYNRADMWERMYGTRGGGTYYFVKNKKTGDLNLVSDYSKIPLLREGDVRQVFNSEGIPMDKFAFFSQKPDLRKLLDLRYTLQQRIKYEMPFTVEEQDKWYEENTTPMTTVVHALAQGRDVEKNMVLLEDFIGENLSLTDRYHYRPASSSVRDYIEIMKGWNCVIYGGRDLYT